MRACAAALVLCGIAALSSCTRPEPGSSAGDGVTSLDAVALSAEIASGRLSAESVTRAYLDRIAALDDAGPQLRAFIEVNPDALDIARDLDRRFREGGVVGPLHGVPVALKANIDTADRMVTSAGSIALAEHRAGGDAPVVARLRAAGAVIIGKTNLSEWANFRSTRSTSGWSSLGGQTRNPYVLDRNPCGSSSGAAVAVAARLAPLAVGTETDGSIVCPAGANGVVGIKPTHALLESAGIVPIAPSQDTAGPIARTVADAALLLDALLGPAASAALAEPTPSAAGARIGVLRGPLPDAALEAAYEDALSDLRAAGAELVDPIELPGDADLASAELEVLLFEFHAALDRYLAGVERGPRDLAALIEFNTAHAREVMPHFGQELLLAAARRGDLDDPHYREAREVLARFKLQLDALFAGQRLDALVAVANGRAWRTDWRRGDAFAVGSSRPAAVSGYPSIVVPAALLSELPVAIALVGPPQSERRLIEIAASFERERGAFPAPQFLPSVRE
jgi:amidase